MARRREYTVSEALLSKLVGEGLKFLPELVRILVNLAMQLEREEYVRAKPYERTSERRDYANGFKPKTVKTRLGPITFAIPQVRGGGFYPSALAKGMRSERALHLALAEMYVQGVSTRKVSEIVERLFGVEVSSAQVSKAAADMDEVLAQWRERPLTMAYVYLYLDARYEQVRVNGRVQDMAVLMAIGVREDGKREVLGVSVSFSEHEVHWRAFLQGLLKRGLRGVRLIISDDHAGLRAARKAVFGGIPWQRCQFHLQQNAQAYVPSKGMQKEVAARIRAIFQAPDRATAERYLAETIEAYQKRAPKLAAWMEANVPEGLTVFDFPRAHWRRIRTTNMVERLNREIRRRTRVVSIFPNEDSCLRLITALLMETSEAWVTGRVYLSITDTLPNSEF